MGKAYFKINLAAIVKNIAAGNLFVLTMSVFLRINSIILLLLFLLTNISCLVYFMSRRIPFSFEFDSDFLRVAYIYLFFKRHIRMNYNDLSFSYKKELVGRGTTDYCLILFLSGKKVFSIYTVLSGWDKSNIKDIIDNLNERNVRMTT